jgi:hypothetical protein
MRNFVARRSIALLTLLLTGTAVAQPAKGLNELGVMAFDAKRYELALDQFGKALALDPDNPAVRKNICAVHQAMANELAAQGKIAEALERVKLGLDVDSDNASALAQAGAYHLRQGNLLDAASLLEKAVSLDPANIEARFLLGETLYEQNKLAEAQAQWDEVLKINPTWPGLQEKRDKLARESMVEQDFSEYASEHFQIRYAKALSESTREAVFKVLEDAYDSVGKSLGGTFPSAPVQVVLYDGEQFAEATQTSAHVGALYDGKIRAPITGKNGRFVQPQVLATRLTHEYVHVIIAQVGGGRVPWWLNEGLAEVFSREMDQNRVRMLRRAYAAERVPSLADLEVQKLDQLEHEDLTLAYAQSHATAQQLWRAGGTKKMTQALKAMRDGTAAEDAIREAFGLDYAALEKNVKAAQRP